MQQAKIEFCEIREEIIIMTKLIKAVRPYIHPEYLNFKQYPYEAWKKLGGEVAQAHYPWRCLHGLAYRYELPTLWKSNKEARLRFVEPVSISFDTFPDYARYEIIPMIWDLWPKYYDKMFTWFKKHDVKTVIISSRTATDYIQGKFPDMNIMYCPEAVDTTLYGEGKQLQDRNIDILEFGRSNEKIIRVQEFENSKVQGKEIVHVATKKDGKFLYTNEQLYEVMGNAKIVISLPRSMTDSEGTGGLETLTQRYWENMLSRSIMLGHAPKELIDIVGYNPVIEIEDYNPNNIQEQILNILAHIEDYQEMVDKNRKVALEKGDWTLRMKNVMEWLRSLGYEA